MSPTDRPRTPWPTVDEPIAVVGATGEQGGAVARTLLARGLKDVARAKGNYADRLAKASAAGMELPEDPAPIEATLNELQTQAR